MQLLALVRTTRVVGLPRLERAITALATLSQDARVGKPVARGEVARQLFAVAESYSAEVYYRLSG